MTPGSKPSPLTNEVSILTRRMPRGELWNVFSTTSLLKRPSNSLRNIKKLCVNWTPAQNGWGAGNAEFVQRIMHLLREPLGPLLLGLEVLLREESLSPRGVEMIGLLHRGVKKEADAIEELLRSTELFEKDAAR